MALSIVNVVNAALASIFDAASEIIRAATYYRPATFSSESGLATTVEITATVTALVTGYRPMEQGSANLVPSDTKTLVRATELTAISLPTAGDYLIESATGQRLEVTSAQLDPTGLLWTLNTSRSLHEDWGDLTAVTVSDDWGDLTANTSSDDRLRLT